MNELENALPADESIPEQDSGNREAAKYRTRLREVEKERDTLSERVTALQRAEIERIAGTKLEKPAGLWASGVELADLLDENGDVDVEKVTAAAETAQEQLGLQQPARGPIIPTQFETPDAPIHVGGFEDAFAPKLR